MIKENQYLKTNSILVHQQQPLRRHSRKRHWESISRPKRVFGVNPTPSEICLNVTLPYCLSRASQVVLVVENLPASARVVGDTGSVPGSGVPWSRKRHPSPVLLPGQRSLERYSPWGRRAGRDWEIEHTQIYWKSSMTVRQQIPEDPDAPPPPTALAPSTFHKVWFWPSQQSMGCRDIWALGVFSSSTEMTNKLLLLETWTWAAPSQPSSPSMVVVMRDRKAGSFPSQQPFYPIQPSRTFLPVTSCDITGCPCLPTPPHLHSCFQSRRAAILFPPIHPFMHCTP